MNDAPFWAERYQLQNCLLRPVNVVEAGQLGEGLAAIDPWRKLGFSAAVLSRAVLSGEDGSRCFGIEISGELCGGVSVAPVWLRGPYLKLLGLLPGHQGLGIGKAVLGWMELEARKSSANSLWTAVSAFNDEAERFYGLFGFHSVARLEDLVAPGHDEILMRKKLFYPKED